jgi:hypothetical protein
MGFEFDYVVLTLASLSCDLAAFSICFDPFGMLRIDEYALIAGVLDATDLTWSERCMMLLPRLFAVDCFLLSSFRDFGFSFCYFEFIKYSSWYFWGF